MGLAYWLNALACFSVPIAFIVWWVRMKMGNDKHWFVRGHNLVSRGIYFALPSALVGMIVFLVGILVWTLDPGTAINKSFISNTVLDISMIIFGISIVTGYILAFFEPDWMSPKWFRWLKREHSDILHILEREANELGRAKWFPMVETQEGLEAWVANVRNKYGLKNSR